VPYRGSAPMLTDLIGGQVQVTFDNLPASIEFIRDFGNLIAVEIEKWVKVVKFAGLKPE
jgi:tripartite-type tricarboxylate transporter receptor subunit TctC